MLLEGKKGIIAGVANKWSIAWGIAKAVYREGGRFILSYPNERLGREVEKIAPEVEALTFQCDLTVDEQIEGLMKFAEEKFGKLDFIVHSVAFAPSEALQNPFVYTSRDAFLTAMNVSVYTLVALVQKGLELLKKSGSASIITMTYLGSEKVVPNYNVMGVAKAALESSVRYLAYDLGIYNIRVNAISAGPVKTLAARGISGFSKMYDLHEKVAPIKKNTDQEELGDTAVFLLSHMSRGITGEVIYVDQGYHILGMYFLLEEEKK